jgi:hypothetical protein
VQVALSGSARDDLPVRYTLTDNWSESMQTSESTNFFRMLDS